MVKVGFICVHNSCRSQMAEAIATMKASDVFISYSAGTHTNRDINEDANAIILEHYDYDMKHLHQVNHIDDLPPLDIVVTMGCNVSCPHLKSRYRFDWGLDDPSGQGREAFEATVKAIEKNVLALKEWIIKAAI